MTKAKRRINKFNFGGEDAHVALVDSAANGEEVLVMKSAKASEEEIKKALDKDVTVKLTIMEFLTRFLGLWWDEAEIIAGMLGYTAEDLYTFEDSAEDFVDYVQRQMDSVEITKSESHEKLREALDSFVSKYVSEESPSSVKQEDGEGNSLTEDNEEVSKTMPKENGNEEVTNKSAEAQTEEERIQKAAEALVSERIEALEKRNAERDEQLQVLKAEREARRSAEFTEKAENLKEHLGDDFDTEQLAKAMDAAEGSETINLLVKALDVLADTKSKEGLLEEVGKSATQEQALDNEDQVEKVQKELMDSEGLTAAKAYVRAWEQVNEA